MKEDKKEIKQEVVQSESEIMLYRIIAIAIIIFLLVVGYSYFSYMKEEDIKLDNCVSITLSDVGAYTIGECIEHYNKTAMDIALLRNKS
jgi:hypothetical protein